MRLYMLILTVFLLFSTSCSEQFKYQDRIINYLEEVHGVFLNNETIIVSISGGCGTCDERSINLINEFSENVKYNNVCDSPFVFNS